MQKPLYATVSSKGQVVIPASLRDKLGIEQGSLLHFQALSTNTFVVRVYSDEEQNVSVRTTTSGGKITGVGLKRVF